MAEYTHVQPLNFGARGTPLQPADRAGVALGFEPGALWVKRDDLTGLAVGGNKARKLEYLCAEALALGADTLVTGGSLPQSNHVAITAAAAARVGMRVRAVVPGDTGGRIEGNVLLDRLFGVDFTWLEETPERGIDAAIAEEAERLRLEGQRPYLVPLGGSTPLAALGYVTAADEIEAEAPPNSVVYHASGTAGTQAGLVAGFGDHSRVRGINTGTPWNLPERVTDLAAKTAHMIGRPSPRGKAQVLEEFYGQGYGYPTPEGEAAILLMARTEGIALDPVYTGKAFAAIIADRRSGLLAPNQPTVFVHTGGLAMLFTDRYSRWLGKPT